ncbi:MAG: hypothetical protein H0U74_23535 [Bradymonadaceae bacterium]|nr:hypothetical protein [Lujinxingiaceae bacterium]
MRRETTFLVLTVLAGLLIATTSTADVLPGADSGTQSAPSSTQPMLAQRTKKKTKARTAPTPPPKQQDEDDDDDDDAPQSSQNQQAPPPTLLRGGRMEFDARLIRGETAGAGAVFLFQRTPRPLPSMTDRRTSYLENTVYSSLGPGWTTQFQQAKGKDGADD